MAYTMATNRHIRPKPGQGWRVWAAVWTLVSWPPAWVGQNSVTGFRHESGSAWAIAGRANRTAITQVMAAAGCRSRVPAATLSTARTVRYSPAPATARATPGSPSAAWGMAADEGLAHKERCEAGDLAHDEGHRGEDQRLGCQYPASLRDGDQAGADHRGGVLGADAEHPEHGDGQLGDGYPRQANPGRVPAQLVGDAAPGV